MGCLQAMFAAGLITGCLAAQTRVPAQDLNDRGIEASARGEYREAEALLRESVKAWREMGPQFEGHAATTLLNLAETQCGQGRWIEGVKMLTESLEMSRRALGPTHIRTVANMNFLASADLILGDFDQAEALFKEALAVERAQYPGAIQLADTLMGLSSLSLRTNHIDQALAPAEEGLRIALQATGENSLDAAMGYANVAQIHVFAHRVSRALPLFKKAESIYATVLSKDHPRYASVLSQEGLALMADGKLALAGSKMERAVDILGRCAGCQYQEAVARSNLGWLRFQQGRYTDADTMLTTALHLQENYSAHPGSEMASTLDRLSAVRRKERRTGEADLLHQRAVQLYSYR
jgi:tetratricopeptide (TPR) repeat protein